MKHWKMRDSEACPRCGESKDTQHVWLCKGSNSNDVWEKALYKLKAWMLSRQTNPDVQHVYCLRTFAPGEMMSWPPDLFHNSLRRFSLNKILVAETDCWKVGSVTNGKSFSSNNNLPLVPGEQEGDRLLHKSQNFGRSLGTCRNTMMEYCMPQTRLPLWEMICAFSERSVYCITSCAANTCCQETVIC